MNASTKQNQLSNSYCSTGGRCFIDSCVEASRPLSYAANGKSSLSVPIPNNNVTIQHQTSSSFSSDEEDNVRLKESYELITKEMNILSKEQREDVYEDIHGVCKIIKENDDLIALALNQLATEISNIKTKSAYDLAERMSSQYVQDYKLRLMFLRATRFDAKQAGKKMVGYFEEKLKYFGKSKLTTTITLSDLNCDELNCLRSGRLQLLPFRDRTGRAIVFVYLKKVLNYESIDSMVIAVLYFWMAILEDEETQRNGIVLLHFTSNLHNPEDRTEKELFERTTKIANCLPFYMASAHFCLKNSTFLTVVSAALNSLQGILCTKIRFHHGSQIERFFALMTFGIPVASIPITGEGELKVDNHLKWLQRRKVMERTILSGYVKFKGIDLPTKFDVLLGKGKPIQNHTGNMYLREIIDEYMVRYGKAKRGEKYEIANSVVEQIILRNGGRFLEQDKDGWWQEVSHETAIRKVCNRFRSQTAADNDFGSKTRKCYGDKKRSRIV